MNVVFHSPSAAAALKAAVDWLEPLLGTSEIVVLSATRAAGDELMRVAAGVGHIRSASIHRGAVRGMAGWVASGARYRTRDGGDRRPCYSRSAQSG